MNSEMYVSLLDGTFTRQHIISIYKSLIWTERFQEAGDFSLVVPAVLYPVQWFIDNRFVLLSSSDELMEIQKISIKSSDAGDIITIEGSSTVKTILNRRIIWDSTDSNKLGDFIAAIIDENVISPSDDKRRMSMVTRFSGMEDEINKVPIEKQSYWGEHVYDAISSVISGTQVGISMSLDRWDPQLWFNMYCGRDLSRTNEEGNIPVVFSSEMNRILDTNYVLDLTKVTTVALVAGASEITYSNQDDKRRPTLIVPNATGESSDLFRYEEFVDAGSISHTDNVKKKVVLAEYHRQQTEAQKRKQMENEQRQLARIQKMRQVVTTIRSHMTAAQRAAAERRRKNAAANEALRKLQQQKAAKEREAREKQALENKYTRTEEEYAGLLTNEAQKRFDKDSVYDSMDGEVARMYKKEYGDVYNLGDIVSVEDKYGNRKDCRIIEFIRSKTDAGYEEYPTFASIDKASLVKVDHSKVRKI